MPLASDMMNAPQGQEEAQGEAIKDRTASSGDAPPVVESPPTAPQASPWWTAPGGKPVDIPAFGRTLLDHILAMLLPAPQPSLQLLPVRIRAKRTYLR